MVPRQSRALQGAAPCRFRPAAENLDRKNPEIRAARAGEGDWMSGLSPIAKSSRHSKITGDFGEYLTLYLLSKHGFECARIDHTGIDIIARNLHTDELMGISVKSRSREEISADSPMNVRIDKKITAACKTFSCKPWYSLVLDRRDKISIYILSRQRLFEVCPSGGDGQFVYWAMNSAAVDKYSTNPDIYRWELTHKIERWWPDMMIPK